MHNRHACLSECWDVTYNSDDSQDISLPERLKGTGKTTHQKRGRARFPAVLSL